MDISLQMCWPSPMTFDVILCCWSLLLTASLYM